MLAAITGFAVFYVVHLTMMYDRFWTTGYDLGIFDQATWLVAHGKTFITIRGLTKYFAGWPLYEDFNLDIPKNRIVSHTIRSTPPR